MSAQIYLIAPAGVEPASFAENLASALDAAPVAALFLPKGDSAENAYKALVKAIVPVAQPRDCAVLIEGDPGWVKTLGADGLHVLGSSKALAAARNAAATLKPAAIVGAGPAMSRHDAMELGELELDYVLFGPLNGALTPEARDMAAWWSETMEVPAVLSDPEARPDTLDTAGCEFVAFGDSVWQAAEGPGPALAALARRLEDF
jgi:thiamine-phosphate pyrophosphorylase